MWGASAKMGGVEFEITFQDGESPADLELVFVGAPTDESFRLLNERLTSDARFRAGLRILVDCSALDTSLLSDAELQSLSTHMVERDVDYPPAAVALFTPDEETFSAARAYRAHVGGSRSNRNVFASRADAVAWLEAQRT
jgi:hypothetical protein